MSYTPESGDALHRDNGEHRTTAATTHGGELTRFETQLRAHLADGPCALHQAAQT